MIDLHSHILPGIDDGSDSVEASVAIARAAVADGTHTMVATPHVSFDFDFDLTSIPRRTGELNAELAEREIPLAVLPGAEIAFTRLVELRTDELRDLSIGSGRGLLVESPHSDVGARIEEALFDLQVRGHRPVLTHPERSAVFRSDIDRLRRLSERGVLCSVTAASLSGAFGSKVRRFALQLFREGLVHNVASDAHDDQRRPPGLRGGFQAAEADHPGLSAGIDWYTRAVPEAVLTDEPLPAAPAPPAPNHSPWGRLTQWRHRRGTTRRNRPRKVRV